MADSCSKLQVLPCLIHKSWQNVDVESWNYVLSLRSHWDDHVHLGDLSTPDIEAGPTILQDGWLCSLTRGERVTMM